tara:strand:- start:6223 stop:7731 length:1509 start_codon:yes stop_codon:yes gene_type:complete
MDHISSFLSYRSIRFRLLATVNSVILVLVGAFFVVDYRKEMRRRFADKRIELEESARKLIPGADHVRLHGRTAAQTYVDTVARHHQKGKAEQHVAIQVGKEFYQAHTHHQENYDLGLTMKRASNGNQNQEMLREHELIVGSHSKGDISVFVSEDISKVKQAILANSLFRLSGILVLGVVATIIVDFAIIRMVIKPIRHLVSQVREIGRGNHHIRDAEFGSAELTYLSAEIDAMSESLDATNQERKFRLDKARRIQQNLLPVEYNLAGLKLAKIYVPAEEVGGDYYDILDLGNEEWLICVADATDHGVPAAMSAAMLKTLLLNCAEKTSSPASILEQMNRTFMKVHLYGDFASIILVKVNLRTRTATFANAGHSPAWLVSPDGQPEELSATGTLLGVIEDDCWEEKALNLQPGCRLVISTDGITESFDATGECFGSDVLLSEILGNRGLCPNKLADHIQGKVVSHRGLEPQTDDVTLLIVDVLEPQTEAHSFSASQQLASDIC